MATPAVEVEGDASDVQLFQKLEDYPWDSDEEFQSGLRAILGPSPTPLQAEQLTLRARCFYYSRYICPVVYLHLHGFTYVSDSKHDVLIDFLAYQTWHANNAANMHHLSNASPPIDSSAIGEELRVANQSGSKVTSPPLNTSDPSAPYSTTFNHIVELISTGQPIPGIREIPDTILEGQATQSVKLQRKKPWEKDISGESTAVENEEQ